ncbi:MAG: response regulator [Ignavibacteriaceae bacterium]|jgi:response regulator of citrate/malate metabolism|nr:response regulator [Ignavibacteriaceae bacterium]
MTVAIVEDSTIIKERIKEKIDQYPEIKLLWEAGLLSDGLRKINEEIPDYLILDIQLPDGNGIDILKLIKEKKYDTTVIILTNYPIGGINSKCCSIGADYFFDKTNEFEKVFSVLKKNLEITTNRN